MLKYDQLTLGDGGPWFGSLALPAASPGTHRLKADVLAGLVRRDGAENLVLTGGEPLHHPDIAAIADAVRTAGYNRILVRTDGQRLSDSDFLAFLLGAGISLFEVMLCGGERGRGTLSARAFRKHYPGLINLRRIGEGNDLFQNIYVAAVVPVRRDNHEQMAALLETAFSTVEIDRVVFCWGDPGFPVWRAGASIERAIELCEAKQVWSVTRGIPPCVIPDKLHHLEELFVRNAELPLLSVPGQCAACCFHPLCSRMPGSGFEYTWEPKPIAGSSCSPYVNDIATKGAVFDETNAHLYSRL